MLAADLLADATLRADTLGIGADRVLIASGAITEDAYLNRLSLRFGLRQADFSRMTRADIELPDAQLRYAAQSGLLRMQVDGQPVIVVTPRQLAARTLVGIAAGSPRDVGHLRLTTEKALQDVLLYRTGAISRHASDGLRNHDPALSAAPDDNSTWWRRACQRVAVRALIAAVLLTGLTFPAAAGNTLALVFLACAGLRLTASLTRPRASAPPLEGDDGLPAYSVIVALYREAPSIPQLLAALTALDYPPEKLDIILVVESDDLATRAAIARQHPPPHVRVIVAPEAGPRTKPKALNVALPFARGSFIAVYDAEDRPDPGQLRSALAAFHNGDDDLGCVQARLAIDNPADSLFARMFAAEYAGQFDVVMPGYDQLGLPWPLGGTSNHFRTAVLRETGAWDAFNVTEDADLGLRMARFGYRTAMIDSTTFEEAPISFTAWSNQRTRWMKGWMQSWWVHARHPRRYLRESGWRGIVARDLMIGGALLAALTYPALLLVFALTFLDYQLGIEISPIVLTPLHGFSIAAGLGVSIAIPLRGLARRGQLRHAWVLALMPLYWACLSYAAWRALRELRLAPYHWSKTEHGLSTRRLPLTDTASDQRPLHRARA